MSTPPSRAGLIVTLDHRGSRLLAYAIEVDGGRIRFGQGRAAKESSGLTTIPLVPHSGVRKLDEVNMMTDAVPLDIEPGEPVSQLAVPIADIPDRPVKLTLYSIETGRPDLLEEFSNGENYRLSDDLRYAEVLGSRRLGLTDPELLVVVWALTDESWSQLQQAR